VHLAYVDESGTPNGDSRSFTLGCVLVEANRWPDVFDGVLGHRRFIKSCFGLGVRAEIKANFLIRNGGPFRTLSLSERARFGIYRGLIRLQPKLGLSTFAVVIRQDVMAERGEAGSVRDRAWEYLTLPPTLVRFT
jgi:hypothetical protein